jgi:hypothetical protein
MVTVTVADVLSDPTVSGIFSGISFEAAISAAISSLVGYSGEPA